MPKLKQGSSQKAQFKAYSNESRFKKNKEAKLEKAAKAQPNNIQLQVALTRTSGTKYTRNKKSSGHTCKGLYKSLGFVKNQPSEGMKKSKLELHHFYGCVLTQANTPNHGKSMCEQFEALGYEKKKYVRKYKKTTR